MARYDDAKFGIIERHWFGLPETCGGDCNTAFTLVNDSTKVKRFYPRGPIYIKKFGVFHVATQGGTDSVITLARNSSTLATVVASTDSAPYTIASKTVNKSCDAGSYLTISNGGTVATGSVAFFIDYHRKFDQADNKWDL